MEIIITALIMLIIAISIPFVILYFVLKALIDYSAKKHAAAIHYDELARKIAAEMIRAQRRIEMQQPTGHQQPATNAQQTANKPNTAQQAAQPQQSVIYAPPAQPNKQSANQQGNTAPEPRRYRPPGV